MTVDPELRAMMHQTVTIERRLEIDEFNAASYDEPETFDALVVGKIKKVITAAGEERVSTTTAYLAESPGLSPHDRITLPTGFSPTQPIILAIDRFPDIETPTDYTEIVYT